MVGLTVASLATAVVLWCLVSLLFPSGLNPVTLIGTMLWAVLGPALVVLAFIAVALALVALLRRRSVFSGALTLISAVALIASTAVVGSVMSAAASAGGSVNAIQALLPSSSLRDPDTVETYVTIDGVALEARVFTPTEHAESAPVLMYIHGGGWVGGDAAQYDGLLTGYADAGWLVVNVDYRLATATKATWDKAPADVGCALAWTARNAERWGGDSSRVTVMGDSAGGNLAVNLGWSAALGQAPTDCPELGPVIPPAAVVAGYPVLDPLDAVENGRQWLDVRPEDFTRDYLGGTPAQHPDRLRAISSGTYISADAPPTLVVEPERDDFIPAAGVYGVVDRAEAGGADVSLVRIPFAHHSFDMVPGSLGEQVRRTVTMDYLDSLGLAP